MPAPLIATAIAALLRKYIARALVWARGKLTIIFTNLMTFLFTIGKDWLESLAIQARTIVLNKDDPNEQDLAKFIAIATNREGALAQEMDRRIQQAGEKAYAIRDEYLGHFDTYSRNVERRYPTLFNEAFRLKLRDRLTAAINRQINDALQRAVAQSALTAQRVSNGKEKLEGTVREKVEAAAEKRRQIAALRSPRLTKQSLAQVESLLRNLKEGDNRHGYTREELENDIKGRKMGSLR